MEIKLKDGETISVDADYTYEIDNETMVVKCYMEEINAPRWFKFLIGTHRVTKRKIIFKINTKEIVYIKE